MNQTNLQIPIDIKTRDKARKVAARQGFSSLQEMVRVILAHVVDERLRIGFVAEHVVMSDKAEARYKKLLSEKSAGKASTSVDELLKELES